MDKRLILVILCFLPEIYRGQQTCSHDIPHGHITWWCGEATDMSMCPYSCDEGYKEHEKVSYVSCTGSGTWTSAFTYPSVSVDELCTPKPCPDKIPNGELSSPCVATVGSSCGYTCNAGYQKKTGVSTITCQTSTNWSVDPHSLCTNNNQCSYELEYGDLDLSCKRLAGETCSFACHLGYIPSTMTEPTAVTCGSSFTWDKPLSSLCEKVQCPATIPDGYIPPTCSRDYKAYCYNYECSDGYQKPPGGPSIRCNASGQWDWERSAAKSLCAREEDLCPSVIKNGQIVWHCSRQQGDTCTYSCNSGCKQSSISWLTCNSDGNWNTNTDILCTECPKYTTGSTTITSTTTLTTSPTRCPSVIPDGELAIACSRSPGTSCGFVCKKGCSRKFTSLFCGWNGSWNFEDTPCNCGEQTTTVSSPNICPAIIPDGFIQTGCNRTSFTFCPYTCKSGCYRSRSDLYCNMHGSWEFADDACDCRENTPYPMYCSLYIPNGIISAECITRSFSRCTFTCNAGCRSGLDDLLCSGTGSWVSVDKACICEEKESFGDGIRISSGNVGIIVGSTIGAVILIVIVVAAFSISLRQRKRSVLSCQAPGTGHQPTVYHTPTNPTANRRIESSVIPPVDTVPGSGSYLSFQPNQDQYNSYLTPYDRQASQPANSGNQTHHINTVPRTDNVQPNHYTSLQEQYNNYLNPYSALQETVPRAGNNIDNPPEYSSIADINMDGYNTIADVQGQNSDPPPTYEESTTNPADFKVQGIKDDTNVI